MHIRYMDIISYIWYYPYRKLPEGGTMLDTDMHLTAELMRKISSANAAKKVLREKINAVSKLIMQAGENGEFQCEYQLSTKIDDKGEEAFADHLMKLGFAVVIKEGSLVLADGYAHAVYVISWS